MNEKDWKLVFKNFLEFFVASLKRTRMKHTTIAKEMIKNNIKSIMDIDEHNAWINDATMKDIDEICKYNKDVFGLKFWDFKIIDHDRLKYPKVFSVDLIFCTDDKQIVFDYIDRYEKYEISSKELVDKLFSLAIYIPVFV